MAGNKISLLCASAICGLAAALPLTAARAADAPAAALPADPSAGSEGTAIVVTARKREEKLQDVPVSIAVIDRQEIERQGIHSLNDVARLIPGFQNSMAFGPDDVRPTLRGISTVRGRPAVAILEDGIDTNSAAIGTVGGGGQINMHLSDIDQVEVVRGPQSTLYGRNAFAGAINYITKGPTDTFQAGINTDVATHDLYDGGGYISGPLTDTLSYRINGGFHYFDGFYKNVTNGDPVGVERSAGIKVQLKYKPSADLQVLLRYEYSYDRNGQQAASLELANATTPGGFAYVAGPVKAAPDTISYFGNLPGLESKTNKGSINVNYDLGGATLTSTTYGLQWNAYQAIDASFGQEPGIPAGFSIRQLYIAAMRNSQVSQEFRLASNSRGRLKWLAGAYFLYENAIMIDETQAFYASCANPLASIRPGVACSPGLNQVSLNLADPSRYPYGFEKRVTYHYSAYGSVGYEPVDGLNLTAEARLAHEDIDVSHIPMQRNVAELGFPSSSGGPFTAANFLPTGGFTLPAAQGASLGTNYFNPRASIDYKIAPAYLVYASFAKGTKPGGFSQLTGTESYVDNSFGPEKLYSYELGLKGNVGNDVLLFDVDGFYSIYKDQQVAFNFIQPVDGIDITHPGVTNAGRATSYGLELQASLRPVKHLVISGNYAHTISKYTDFQLLSDDAASALFPNAVLNGNYLPDVPKDAATLNVRLEGSFRGTGKAFAEVVQSYESRRYLNSDSTNAAWVPHFFQTDADVGIESNGWSIEIYVKNAFNDDTPRSGLRYGDLASVTASQQAVVVMLAPKRQLGLRTRVKF